MYLRLKERKTKNLQDLKISGDSVDSFALRICGIGGRSLLLLAWKKYSKCGLIPWTKIILGGECLVWEVKQNFLGLRAFLNIYFQYTSLKQNTLHYVAVKCSKTQFFFFNRNSVFSD